MRHGEFDKFLHKYYVLIIWSGSGMTWIEGEVHVSGTSISKWTDHTAGHAFLVGFYEWSHSSGKQLQCESRTIKEL